MKGHVYYPSAEAKRNIGFIGDLKEQSARLGISLSLRVDEEVPDQDADFMIYRSRDAQLARKFESRGFRLFNRASVNEAANDKLKTFQLASMLGVPAIPTRKWTETGHPPFPFVIKTANGHGGGEVFLCTDESELNQAAEQLPGHPLLVQPYIESKSTDVRVFMIGTEVVGAVKRTGCDSFKSNYTLGGQVEAFEPPAELAAYAVRIAEALRSDYIGIDFLPSGGGWLLNEIEDPVGARSLYATHGFSVAGLLMEHILKELWK